MRLSGENIMSQVERRFERRISLNKLLSSVVTAAAILTIGVTSQAETTTNESVEQTTAQQAPQQQAKQDYEAKFKEAQQKFDALTDKQRKELYDLYDKINVQKLKLLDKYVEFGLVSKEEADVIRTEMAAHAKEMRDSKKLVPPVGLTKHKHHENKETASEKEVAPETDENGAESEEKKAE
ncbi:MAG TPA: hypothetical protein DCY20_11420 [Firmicutes bacterium]|nr:hypothetical protein [Bacillota bacterium]